MLKVLDLFTEQTPVLSAEDITAKLRYSRPTGYRYVRELVTTGLLVRAPRGYALGPRIIELDWIIRTQDPVLMASRKAVRELAMGTGCDVTQMGMYGERIVTIHHEPGPQPLEIGFDRGRPIPLFRGAPSKAILAFLPRARLERLYRKHHPRGTVAGSVCLVLTKAQHDTADPASLVEKLLDCAARISEAVEPRKINEPLNRSIARAPA